MDLLGLKLNFDTFFSNNLLFELQEKLLESMKKFKPGLAVKNNILYPFFEILENTLMSEENKFTFTTTLKS
jgi:hypothetical protein